MRPNEPSSVPMYQTELSQCKTWYSRFYKTPSSLSAKNTSPMRLARGTAIRNEVSIWTSGMFVYTKLPYFKIVPLEKLV